MPFRLVLKYGKLAEGENMGIIKDTTVYHGRPSDKRIDKEEKAYDLLEKWGIEFERVDHDAANTIEECLEVDSLLEMEICKNLFLCNSSGTNYYLLLMPGNKKFRTAELSKQIGSSRLSFASYETLEKMLDLTPGSVTVMGLMNDPCNKVRLLIDSDVLKQEFFGCHPMINTSSLRFKTKDLVEKLLPAINHEFIEVTLKWE